MLRLLCNTILREKATDCWIVPVSVQYDRVIETETYVDELLGKPKEKESLLGLISGGGEKLQLKLGSCSRCTDIRAYRCSFCRAMEFKTIPDKTIRGQRI
jgi:hypothetical protein